MIAPSTRHYSNTTYKTSFAYGGIKPGNPLDYNQLSLDITPQCEVYLLFTICQITTYRQYCTLAQRHAAIELGDALDPACDGVSTDQGSHSSSLMPLTFNDEILLDDRGEFRIAARLEPAEYDISSHSHGHETTVSRNRKQGAV